jgi:DNA polymerase-3 subunit beta
MPILGTLLLKAAGSGLRLAATDLEIGLETSCEAEIAEPGVIALPARLLAEIIANLPDGHTQIESSETGATITAGTTRFDLAGMSTADFPALPEPPGDAGIRLDGATLLRLIRSTAFAVSTDETRPFLTGALLTIDGHTVRMVATDGGRLALRSAGLEVPAPTAFAGIVPRRALAEALRILPGEDIARLSWTDTVVFLQAGTTRLSARLLAGTFPPYQGVLDKVRTPILTLTAAREPLAAALRRVSITSDQDSNNMVTLAVNGTTLTLSAKTPSVGSAIEKVAVEAAGGSLAVAFNARFLLDALDPIDAERVRLGLTGATSPAILTPADRPEPLCVMAPVRPRD